MARTDRRTAVDSRRSTVDRRIGATEIPASLHRRVVIECIAPDVDNGRFPIKRTVGEPVTVTADIFANGHDMVVAVPGMRPMSKADSLGVMASGRMKFDRYESSDTVIRIYEGTAVVTGRIQRTRTNNGREFTDDWLFTKVYVRRSGRWQVVSFHASNAPN